MSLCSTAFMNEAKVRGVNAMQGVAGYGSSRQPFQNFPFTGRES